MSSLLVVSLIYLCFSVCDRFKKIKLKLFSSVKAVIKDKRTTDDILIKIIDTNIFLYY